MKNTMLKKKMPLVAATWTDAFRRVCNRIALVAAAICTAAAPLSSFAEAKEATLKTTYSGSAITDGFQVLVKLSEGDAYGFSYTEAGGASHNIWFTSADGATVYPHEIDKWDTSGDSFVWVRLPELASGTTFKMHWSDSASDVQSASGNVNVWDGYVGVWHMNASGTADEPDSTGHGLNAVSSYVTTDNRSVMTTSSDAKVGTSRINQTVNGTGSSNFLKVSNYKGKMSSESKFSMSGWFKATGTMSGYFARIFSGCNGAQKYWDVVMQKNATKLEAIGSGNGSTFVYTGNGTTVPTITSWFYLTVVWDDKNITAYANGSQIHTGTVSTSNAQPSFFSIGGFGSTNPRGWYGQYDEVRMYNGAMTADRVKADYATMNDPTAFLTLVPAAQAAALTHRWSFNSNDKDEITGADPADRFGTRNISDGQVHFTGNSWGGGSLSLGTGSLGSGDATVEIWATQDAVRNNSVIFSYSDKGWGTAPTMEACMQWTSGTDINKDALWLSKDGANKLSRADTMAPYTLGKEYHIAMTFHDNGDGSSTVHWQKRDASTGMLEKEGNAVVDDWTLSTLTASTATFAIGVWKTNIAKDACASYNEVRIWNGVLSDDQLAANASMGPDVYASGLTEGFELAAGTKFNVPAEGYAASGPVTLGAGAKLRFDSAKFQGQTVTFSAAGYSVPSGSILDYVELTDPFNFTVSLSGNTITVAPVSVASSAVDYFVEWVQPSSANLYVDTGVQGKVGVKAELQYIHVQSVTYPVMLGSWGGNNKRFNLAMHWGEQARWEYGNQMNDLGAITRYGVGCTVEVVVPTDGKMSCTWTTTRGERITPTMDATATYGLLDTATTLYLFASHYKDASSDTANQPHAGRLYYCKLWEGDTGAWTLARNFRPCVKDGVAGLYDYVTGEVHYPVSSVANCVLVAGPVAYDRIATWNGGATPTTAELGTAANWTCTDKSGASLQSAVPDRTTLAVFPSGIGSVTLPAGYTAPWGAVSAEGGVAHPATQYGTCGNSRNNVILPAYRYTAVGEGSLSDLVKVNGATSAINFSNKQVRHDGWFYVNAAQAGTWAMTLYVDDYYAFFIDDVEVLSYHTYSGGVAGTATCEVSEGWHRFTSIIGDTGGGWGTSTTFGNDKVPFTFAVNGTTYTLTDDTTFPKGSGTSTITLTADANWSALGKVALQGGARIDLNGHTLVVDDILADDYIGTVITNSAAKKSVLYFLGDLLESKAYATGIIKEANEKIILAHDGDQVATWTGAANDGNPATAGNWEDLASQPVVPTAAYAVKIVGSNVNMQCPAGTDIACKSFEIGNCTFTADCDWRGLSHTPVIDGTANLNGHNLHLSHLVAVTGGSFANGAAGVTNEVRFTAADTTYSSFGEGTFIENAANLSLAGNVRIALVKEGNGTFSSSGFMLGNQAYEVDFVQTNGTANHTSAQIGISGHHGVYRMSGGTVKATSDFEVGPNGVGEFLQTGGSVTLQNWFNLGRHKNGNGTYTITGGSLLVNKDSNGNADKVYVGCANNSKGTLKVGGDAQVQFKCHLSLGVDLDGQGSKGYVNVYGNGSLHTTGDTYIGQTNGETGEATMDGGTFKVDSVLRVGYSGSGVFRLNGGALSAGSWAGLGVNSDGTGTFTQNGGTFTMANNTLNVGNDGKGWYYQNGGTNKQLRVAIGANNQNNANGTYDIKGGLLDVSSYLYVGGNKVGQLVIGGDGVVIANGGVTIANGSTGSGTLTVTGGVLKTTFLQKGSGTLNSVTFNGGTLVATNAASTAATFFSGIGAITVGANGFVFDVASYTISLPAAVSIATNATIAVKGTGTLDVSGTTFNLTAAPTEPFDLLTTEDAAFSTLPTVTVGGEALSGGWRVVKSADGKKITIKRRKGVMIIAY